ncbi:MAG TPA: phage Gp37/Gp68 family protein [Ktedonobacteraceae bacterium]|jgi:protein gp37
MAKTNIQWAATYHTDGSVTKGETWNPVTGCSKVSPACAHCYAEALSLRYGWSKHPWTPQFVAENIVLHPDRLKTPLTWCKKRTVFVNSMSDLFHEYIPMDYIAQVYAIMALASEHTFQVLTKRPQRMQNLLTYPVFEDLVDKHVERISGERGWCITDSGEWPLKNVWHGVSVENQHWADIRIPYLLRTPSVIRFLSCEPLLGSVDLDPYLQKVIRVTDPDLDAPDGAIVNGMQRVKSHWFRTEYLHWIIVGGESGPKHRPMQPRWAHEIFNQCQRHGVAFFFKQWGGRTPKAGGDHLYGQQWHQMPGEHSGGNS